MDRLTEKLNRAAGVVGRVTTKLEEKADFVIAREDAIDKRGQRLFDAKHAILDAADKGLDGIEAKLALLSNDPLPDSGGSQDSLNAPPAIQPAPQPENAPASLGSPLEVGQAAAANFPGSNL